MLPGEVHSHAAGPGALVGTLRALEDPHVGVRAQPVLGHPGQVTHAVALRASEQLLGRIVARDLGLRPLQAVLADDPLVVVVGVGFVLLERRTQDAGGREAVLHERRQPEGRDVLFGLE